MKLRYLTEDEDIDRALSGDEPVSDEDEFGSHKYFKVSCLIAYPRSVAMFRVEGAEDIHEVVQEWVTEIERLVHTDNAAWQEINENELPERTIDTVDWGLSKWKSDDRHPIRNQKVAFQWMGYIQGLCAGLLEYAIKKNPINKVHSKVTMHNINIQFFDEMPDDHGDPPPGVGVDPDYGDLPPDGPF